MTSFLSSAKRILSDKWVTLAIIVFSILGRIIQLIFFFNLRLDASHQVIATRNFLKGAGISMAKAYANDLSVVVYEPLINWPPGYSILLAPFYALFGGNYIAAGLCLGIIAAIVLILVFRSILKLLELPIYLINLSTIIAGFYIYYFYFIASSDAITISLAMVAIYYALKLLKRPTHAWLKNILGITIPLFICGAIKYLFIPVVLVVPLYIALKGWDTKVRALKKAGILSSLVLVLAFGALLAWQKSISGSATYISEPGRGFFPNHLLDFFPFIPGSYIKPDTITMVMPNYAEFIFIVYKLLHVLLFLALTFIVLKRIFKKRLKNQSLPFDFFSLTLFISWAITLLLAVLSIQVEEEAWDGGHMWTYIEEQRYYGLPIVLIQLATFIYYHHYRENRKSIIQYFLAFLFTLMFIETLRGMIFDAKRIKNFPNEEFSWQSELKIQQYADSLVKQRLEKTPASGVVVGGPFYYVNHRVSLYSNASILAKPEWIKDLSLLHTKDPVLLLVILSKENFAEYKPFLQPQGFEVAGQFKGLYFYTVYVNIQ